MLDPCPVDTSSARALRVGGQMLVRFHSQAGPSVLMFGDDARALLLLMGMSGDIPGAVAEKRTVVASRQTSCKPNPVINLTKRAFRNREAFGSCRAPCSLSLTFPGMGSFMILTTEEMGEIPNVKAADIDRILPTDSFGKFAVLSASDTTFLQAGNDWQPTPECEAFLKNTRSDPWVLEYRDGESGKQYRAHGQLTLDQVRVAFLSYLAGSKDWQNAHAWNELAL